MRKRIDFAAIAAEESDIEIINKTSLSKRLKLSESTVYRWTKLGILPKPILSPSGSIQGWLASSIKAWELEQLNKS